MTITSVEVHMMQVVAKDREYIGQLSPEKTQVTSLMHLRCQEGHSRVLKWRYISGVVACHIYLHVPTFH